jgi:two-component system OmpR family response regulator
VELAEYLIGPWVKASSVKKCFRFQMPHPNTVRARKNTLRLFPSQVLPIRNYQMNLAQSAEQASMANDVAHILLVEDDLEISKLICELLIQNGLSASIVSSGLRMDDYLSQYKVDLLILDVMLPGENGFDICKRVRAASEIPILMLTALGSEIDRVVGLEIGADDYLAKPFASRELVARVRALLRRSKAEESRRVTRAKFYRFRGWALEPTARCLFNPDSVRVALTSTEFDLLLALCQNPGKVLSRDQLLEMTHSGLAGPIARTIDVHISRLRQKIEADGDVNMIQTVRLGGYIFTPQVEVN